MYASKKDDTPSIDLNLSALIKDIDAQAIYLMGKDYVSKLNTQENKDKAFKLYLDMVENVTTLSNEAKVYIKSIYLKKNVFTGKIYPYKILLTLKSSKNHL